MGEKNDGTKQKRSGRVTSTASRTSKIRLVTTLVATAGAIVGCFFGPILAYLLGLCGDPFICIDWRWFLLGACLGFLLPCILGIPLALGFRLVPTRKQVRIAGILLAILSILALVLWWGVEIHPLNSLHLRLQYQLGRRDFSDTDLRGANLQEANLAGVELHHADLREANLRGANLHHAFLLDTDLRGANLMGADLRRARLRTGYLDSTSQIDPKWRLVCELSNEGGSGRDLSGSDLAEANLKGADLGGVDLSRADLSGANLEFADLSGANLSRADLSGADFFFADLIGADLTEADLTGARLFECDLSLADLTRADLTGATISAEQLGQAFSLNRTTLPDGTVHE